VPSASRLPCVAHRTDASLAGRPLAQTRKLTPRLAPALTLPRLARPAASPPSRPRAPPSSPPAACTARNPRQRSSPPSPHTTLPTALPCDSPTTWQPSRIAGLLLSRHP